MNKDDMLDWAETIICNSRTPSYCSQDDWDRIITKWRHHKHALGRTKDPFMKLTNEDPTTCCRDAEVMADKEQRKALDAQLQLLKAAAPSRERSLAITKLQECIMWLGMDLKRLNEPNPYPSSYNPASPVVEPTADGLRL